MSTYQSVPVSRPNSSVEDVKEVIYRVPGPGPSGGVVMKRRVCRGMGRVLINLGEILIGDVYSTFLLRLRFWSLVSRVRGKRGKGKQRERKKGGKESVLNKDVSISVQGSQS